MKIRDFKLEVFFGKYEFTAPYLLTQSDCESMTARELLAYEPGSEEGYLDTWLGYTEVPGNPALRGLVASLYRDMSDEDILMHTGAQEAIFAYMNVILEKGDHVVSLFPIYQSLYEVANAMGCEVSRWQLRQADGGWALDFDELESLVRPTTKAIVVNTPNNPTGYTLNREEIEKLCAIASKRGIRVFADEVYRGLDLDGAAKPWVADLYDRATSLGVMSKAYGFAGLRVGWVASKDRELLDKMTKFKHYLSICNSCASEYLSVVALKHSEEILERNRGIIRENLRIADGFFARHAGLFANNAPQGGPVAFHRMNIGMPMEDFCERLVRKAGVLLLPANIYDYEGPYFRMGYGRKSFAQNLQKFEEYLAGEKFA